MINKHITLNVRRKGIWFVLVHSINHVYISTCFKTKNAKG